MLMPSIFANDLMDGFFDAPERNYKKNYYNSGLMKTDIKESKDGFEVIMDLPGFKKDEIKAELKDGYMTITAASDKDNKIEDENSRYICRERVYSNCSRTFYVGKELTQEDIKAKFENGVLTLNVPKKEALPQKEEDKYISILRCPHCHLSLPESNTSICT